MGRCAKRKTRSLTKGLVLQHNVSISPREQRRYTYSNMSSVCDGSLCIEIARFYTCLSAKRPDYKV